MRASTIDMTHCTGHGCPRKHECLRFTSQPDSPMVSYISPPDPTSQGCDLFITHDPL